MPEGVEIRACCTAFQVRINESTTGQNVVPTVFIQTRRRIGTAVNAANKLNRFGVLTTFMPLTAVPSGGSAG